MMKYQLENNNESSEDEQDHPIALAAFDFDYTLTTRDSLSYFLRCSFSKNRLLKSLFRLAIPSFYYLVGSISRQEIKELILKEFLAGMPVEVLQQMGKAYAQSKLNDILREEGMKKLAWHHSQGHILLLVSASPDFYLKSWSKRHSFSEVFCSRLEVDETGKVTGKLVGKNCWGEEKRNYLEKYMQEIRQKTGKEVFLYAYGDSRGDKEMLDLADCAFYQSF